MTEDLLATMLEETEAYLDCDDRASPRRMIELKKKLKNAGATRPVCIAVETLLAGFRAREARKGVNVATLKEGMALILDRIPHGANFHLGMSTNVESKMGDERYEISGGQQGAVGHKPRAQDFTQHQVAVGPGSPLDLTSFARELEVLKKAMHDQATEPEHYTELATVTSAEKAAKAGDETGMSGHLKGVGKWGLGIATSLGIPLLVEYLKQKLHLSH